MSKLPVFSIQFGLKKKFIFPPLQSSANMEIYSNINLIHAENVKMSLNLSVVSAEAYEFRDQAHNLTQIWNNIEFPGPILNSKGFIRGFLCRGDGRNNPETDGESEVQLDLHLHVIRTKDESEGRKRERREKSGTLNLETQQAVSETSNHTFM